MGFCGFYSPVSLTHPLKHDGWKMYFVLKVRPFLGGHDLIEVLGCRKVIFLTPRFHSPHFFWGGVAVARGKKTWWKQKEFLILNIYPENVLFVIF